MVSPLGQAARLGGGVMLPAPVAPTCRCCGAPGETLRFAVRAISGRHCGRVLPKGAALCDACSDGFVSY